MNYLSAAVTLCRVVCFVLPLVSLSGQETNPPPALKLEEAADRLSGIDAELTRKADEVRTLVEREALAKRLPEPVAQSLRWSLRTAVTGSGLVDVRGVLATARVPIDNEQLAQAFKELEAANADAQKKRNALLSDTVDAVRREVISALRTATKDTDLSKLQKTIETTRDAFQRNLSSQYREINVFSAASGVLETLRQALEAQANGSWDLFSQSINSLAGSYTYQDAMLSREAAGASQRLLEPTKKQITEARDRLENAIIEGKPADDLKDLFRKLEVLAGPLENGSLVQRNFGARQIVGPYRRIVDTLVAAEGGEPGNERQRLQAAREALQLLNSPNAVKLARSFDEKEQAWREAQVKKDSAEAEKFVASLNAVKTVDALDTLIQELGQVTQEAGGRSNAAQERWRQLANTLTQLAAIWRMENPAMLLQERESRMSGAPLAAELQALRERIERDVFSRSLRFPELLQPPLNEQPPAVALETIADQLAAKGEWRRLCRLLETRNPFRDPAGRGADAVQAIRSFIAGQNFELAEQWNDARLAYKEVLRSTSERVPIKEAAERIKALDREHPAPAGTSSPVFIPTIR